MKLLIILSILFSQITFAQTETEEAKIASSLAEIEIEKNVDEMIQTSTSFKSVYDDCKKKLEDPSVTDTGTA
jgi:hypothetical protein